MMMEKKETSPFKETPEDRVLQMVNKIESVKWPKGKISRRDFLRKAAFVAPALGIKKEPKEKEKLSLPLSLLAVPLLAWVNKEPADPKRRKKRAIIALSAMTVAAVLGGGTFFYLTRREEIEKRGKEKQEMANLPEAWQARLQAREALTGPSFDAYKSGKDFLIYPANIKDPSVREYAGRVGPSWMFEPGAKEVLKKTFGRDFTDEQIKEYQANPQKDQEIVEMLRYLEQEGRVTHDVVGFYEKALTSQGREEIFSDFLKEFSLKAGQ